MESLIIITNQQLPIHMKKIIISFLVALPLPLFAQTLSYSYDAMGNRVTREIVLKRNAAAKKDTTTFFSDMLDERPIRIYPNPTKGQLKVNIPIQEGQETPVLKIYSSSGQLIHSEKATSETTTLDISSHPNGLYLLHVIIGKEESTWKIIKK